MSQLESIRKFEDCKCKVWYVCWDPNGSILASCGSDKLIRLWEKSAISRDGITQKLFER